jgi:ParB family chromosome partitioning protein
MESMGISQIIIEDRCREDLGDIEGLADSISRVGLLHPIIVDEANRLVAGQRRLEACRSLDWETVPVRRYAELTDDERLAIEIEENRSRKDLTPEERSQERMRQAEQLARGIFVSATKFPTDGRRGRGRPSKRGVPRAQIAAAMGTSEATLRRADARTAAVERYPQLSSLQASDDCIIAAARKLDALPTDQRDEQLALVCAGGEQALAAFLDRPRRGTKVQVAVATAESATDQALQVVVEPSPDSPPPPGLLAQFDTLATLIREELQQLSPEQVARSMTNDEAEGALQLREAVADWFARFDTARFQQDHGIAS